MLPKILVATETGPKGQNQPKNWVFEKYLKNASLDFFDFVHDIGPLYVFPSYVCGMLPKILVWVLTGSKGQNWPENWVFGNISRTLPYNFLILCMILDHYKCFLATYVTCYRKFLLPRKRD